MTKPLYCFLSSAREMENTLFDTCLCSQIDQDWRKQTSRYQEKKTRIVNVLQRYVYPLKAINIVALQGLPKKVLQQKIGKSKHLQLQVFSVKGGMTSRKQYNHSNVFTDVKYLQQTSPSKHEAGLFYSRTT